MVKILCYGDSNTWGTVPDGTCAHCNPYDAYPGILQQLLGENYEVITEGLPARTTNIDDIKYPKGNRNGLLFYPQCVISHEPLDYIVIMLGTNDLKSKFDRSAEEIVKVIEIEYIQFTYNVLSQEISKTSKIILVAPAVVDEDKFEGFEGATEKSKQFDNLFQQVAKNNNCLFVSNKNLIVGEDGIHLTTKSHHYLANELARLIKIFI